MIRRLLASLLLLAALAFAPVVASAQSPANRLDTILARGTLRVGFTGDYRPFDLRDAATGQITGLDVDMAENLAASLGVKLELVPTAWGSLMADLAAEKFDIGMGGISITLDRQRVALFSTPVMRSGKTPIARCDAAARFQTLADIDQPGVRVLTNPGGTNERFARAHIRQAEIVVFPQNATIFNELVAGHADVMMTDAVETRLQAGLHPELCAVHPDQPFDFSELAYLLPRDAVLKAYVDQWLHLAQETGAYQHATAKWLP